MRQDIWGMGARGWRGKKGGSKQRKKSIQWGAKAEIGRYCKSKTCGCNDEIINNEFKEVYIAGQED